MEYNAPELTNLGKAHNVVLGQEQGFRDLKSLETSPDPDQLLGLDE
jgi:hypothetical protein